MEGCRVVRFGAELWDVPMTSTAPVLNKNDIIFVDGGAVTVAVAVAVVVIS